MKITLVNQYTGPLFIDVVNAFAKSHQVCLVTGSIHEAGTALNPSVRIKKLIKYRRNSSWSRFLTWTIFILQCIFYLLHKKTDHVIFVTNPPFTPFIGSLLHKIRKQPFSLLIYDLYPDVLGNLGYLSDKRWMYKMWGRLNSLAFKKSSHIFTISTQMASRISAYLIGSQKEITVIPPWANNEFIKPMVKDENPFCIDQKIEDKFVVLYSGNMGITHDLESIVAAATALKNEQGISFMMIGDGAKRKALLELSLTANLTNLHFLAFQPVAMLPFSLASGDIAVITLGKGAEMLSVPSKTYSMLAAGCALLVIADQKSEIARLAVEHECGEVFEPGDVEGIIAFIKLMHTNKLLLEKYKENARRASFSFTQANAIRFVEYFDLQHRIEI